MKVGALCIKKGGVLLDTPPLIFLVLLTKDSLERHFQIINIQHATRCTRELISVFT